ncbi:MAG: PEP-CTERM sorting domain-containing protein [Chthoniobacterales bacterium]
MKKPLSIIAAIAALAFAVAPASAQTTLNANPTTNNGGSTGWGIFFDLSAATPLMITGMTTASSAAAGATFSIEIYTRMGSGLGGPVGSGPGSSPAGWTSLGMVTVTQGATSGGISLPIALPNFSIAGGNTVGVAIVFTGAGPSYFGTGTPPIQQFTDGTLTLATGDARTAPFTTTGSFFSSRGLTGSITYNAVPEPSSIALLALGGLGGLIMLQRRQARR